MTPDQSRYLRFVAAAEGRAGRNGEYIAVTAPGGGQTYRLTEAEYALANLFDGERDADARRTAATEVLDDASGPDRLGELTGDLAEAGLLVPGTDEPLPPPAQVADRITDQSNELETGQAGFPPSSMPGSLGGPGAQGPLVGAASGYRGSASGPRVRLPLGPLAWIGHAFNATLYPAWLRWLPVVLTLTALYGLWINRIDASRDALMMLAAYRLVLVGMASSLLINLISQLARAAAVAHYTGERPPFGLDFAFGFIPRFATATEGPAERADARGRLGIVAAPLNALMMLFVLAVLGWFLARGSGTLLGGLCLVLAVFAMVGFLLRLNPLVRRDGYFLLAHALDVPDLREQAWLSLFGVRRPWADRPAPRKTPIRLYALAVIAYIVAIVVLILLYPGRWLEQLWGGTGVVVFLLVMAAVAWEQSKRVRAGRGRLESWKLETPIPSRKAWLAIVLFALLALFPYTYEPSGPLTILPQNSADVRAQIPGRISEVKVQEGDRVESGDIVVQLANAEQRAQVASAKAKLRKSRAELSLVKRGAREEEIELARQRVTTARRRLHYSSEEASRLKSAYERNAVSIAAYQEAAGSAAVQREQLAEAEARLALVTADARDDRIASLEAEIEAQKAQLAYHQAQLEATRLRAPIDGRVVSGSLMFGIGDFLEPGELIATIENASSLLAEVQMPESVIAEVETGANAEATVWAHPWTGFGGTVKRIAPSAEETDHGKAVRVLVALDRTASVLRPGMTGHAKVAAGTYPAIVVFTRALARFVLVEVWSWLP